MCMFEHLFCKVKGGWVGRGRGGQGGARKHVTCYNEMCVCVCVCAEPFLAG